MGDLSAADVLAMTRDNNNSSFLEGNGIIILILFFLMLGGGFGGGFGNNGFANAAMQGSLTRAEMQDGFNNQNTVNTLNNMSIAMNNGFNGVAMGMNNGFNTVNSSLANLGFNMQQCCCELKTTVHSEGEATRALLVAQENQNLRDRLNEKDRELNAAIFTNSQQIQTRTLEDFILANKTAPATTA